MPEKRSELYVGVFLFVGLVLLGALILQFGRFKERLGGNYEITVVFDDASGLIKGSEVRMGGARIGEVTEAPKLNDAVQVEVSLAISSHIRIPSGSTFEINSATLLGDKLVVVSPPAEKNGRFIQPGSRQQGGGHSGLEALQKNAESVSRDVSRLLKQAGETLHNADAAVEEITMASRQFGDSLGKLNRTTLSDANLAHIDRTIANLEEVSNQWKQTGAKLDPALSETREAVAAVKSTAVRAAKTLDNADDAMHSLSAAARKAGNTFDRMNRGEGMLGAFASDNEIALDFKAFMKNLRRHGILLYKNDSAQSAEPADPPRKRLKGRPR